MWSKVRFSPNDHDDVLDGGGGREAGSSVLYGFVFGPGVLHQGAKDHLRRRDQGYGNACVLQEVPADCFKGFIEVPRQLKNYDPKGLVDLLGCFVYR